MMQMNLRTLIRCAVCTLSNCDIRIPINFLIRGFDEQIVRAIRKENQAIR